MRAGLGTRCRASVNWGERVRVRGGRFNADDKWDVREPAPEGNPAREEFSVEQRIELLTHRGFVQRSCRTRIAGPMMIG